MSVVNIRTRDLDDNHPMKDILIGMNKCEEENIILSMKDAINKGKYTHLEVCNKLKQFMGLFGETRNFYFIPDYIASLN